MNLVADANILFCLCIKTSSTSTLAETRNVQLHSPRFALKELEKYKETILEKSGEDDFSSLIRHLQTTITFTEEKKYAHHLRQAKKALSDKKDADYLALAMTMNAPLWSNDKEMKKQGLVPVLNTADLVELLS